VNSEDGGAGTRRLELVLDEQERERADVSRRLHDELAQSLAFVLLGLDVLERKLTTAESGTVGRLREELAEALGLCTELALALRPPTLDQLGLRPALGSLARRTGAAPVSIDPRLATAALAPELETGVYRVVQAALAAAEPPRSLAVSLDAEGSELELSVQGGAIGRVGALEARVELLGGRLEPAVGTLTARIPLRAIAAFPQRGPVETPDGVRRALP
jgi:signal transduction histidine kinase